MNMVNERIIVDEDAGHAGYVVTRERDPVELAVWRGCGPERGAWEDAREVAAEYTPPGRDA